MLPPNSIMTNMLKSSGLIQTCGKLPELGLLSRIRRSNPMKTNNTHLYANRTFEAIDIEDEPVDVCHTLSIVLDFSHLYYVPTIILLGLIGNLLSCIVFLNTHLKMRSSSYYLAALATTDFSFLVTVLLVWLNNTVGWEVFNKDGWCEMVVYVSSVCSSLSVWLIVAFTVERFIAVQYPLHRPHICTITRAKTIVLILTILALISHSYSFVIAGVMKNPEGAEECVMKIEYLEAMRIVSIIDSIASLIAPLILIIVMNTMITRNLLRFSKRFRQSTDISMTHYPSRDKSDINLHQISNGNSDSNNDVHGNIPLNSANGERKKASQPSFHTSKSIRSHSRHNQPSSTATTSTPRNIYRMPETTGKCIHIRSSSKMLVSTRNQQSITKMLLLISTVFVLLNLPSYVIRLCVFFFTLARKDTPVLLWCLQQFFMLLYYTNFSINFLLYSMCGITFRRCLEQLLRKVFKSITRYQCNPQRYI